jgi:hypothetical protein
MKLLLENWRKFLNEEDSSAALNYLENAFKNEHASGRPFSKQFDEKLEEEASNVALKIVNEITPSYLTQVLKKYQSVGFEGSIDMNEISDPKEIAIMNSILLFTAGNVATVRNPEGFKPESGEEVESPRLGWYQNIVPKYHKGPITDKSIEAQGSFSGTWFGEAIPYVIKPTKELYTIARYVMTQIANLKNPDSSTHIYRGMSLPAQVALSLKEGSTFFAGSIVSWTTNEKIAENYETASSGFEGPAALCMFEIESAEIGASIDFLSAYKYEREFILGRKLKILSIEASDISSMMGHPAGSGQSYMVNIKCDEI